MTQYISSYLPLKAFAEGPRIKKQKKNVQMARTVRESSITRSYELTNKKDSY